MNEMTEDTKAALDAIKPIADILNIKVDADRQFLFCNGQAIGISSNSTYATVKEFIGFAMQAISNRPDCHFKITNEVLDSIRRCWISEDMVKEILKVYYWVTSDG